MEEQLAAAKKREEEAVERQKRTAEQEHLKLVRSQHPQWSVAKVATFLLTDKDYPSEKPRQHSQLCRALGRYTETPAERRRVKGGQAAVDGKSANMTAAAAAGGAKPAAASGKAPPAATPVKSDKALAKANPAGK